VPEFDPRGESIVASIYGFEVTALEGGAQKLSDYRNRVLLIVNTASECGFTPQYQGLEDLHHRYEGDGLAVLGFPCNQFGGQEPGDAAQIREFCEVRYGVSFPLFAKIDVNGPDAHPLFEHLKEAAPGLLGSRKVKWNFTKFLVSRSGEVLERFASATKPEKLEEPIQKALAAER
jgi:glutathione peroxidase